MTLTAKESQPDMDAADVALEEGAHEALAGRALVSARRKHRRARRLARRAQRAAHPPVHKPRKLFVYGTSLEGEPKHHWLRTAAFLGETRTRPTFQLYEVGDGPALVRGGTQAIAGELYEIDVFMLGTLDWVDRHLQRTSIVLHDGTAADAYVLPPEQAPAHRLIHLNDWRLRSCNPRWDIAGRSESCPHHGR